MDNDDVVCTKFDSGVDDKRVREVEIVEFSELLCDTGEVKIVEVILFVLHDESSVSVGFVESKRSTPE